MMNFLIKLRLKDSVRHVNDTYVTFISRYQPEYLFRILDISGFPYDGNFYLPGICHF
jgi:hypothetical protein